MSYSTGVSGIRITPKLGPLLLRHARQRVGQLLDDRQRALQQRDGRGLYGAGGLHNICVGQIESKANQPKCAPDLNAVNQELRLQLRAGQRCQRAALRLLGVAHKCP